MCSVSEVVLCFTVLLGTGLCKPLYRVIHTSFLGHKHLFTGTYTPLYRGIHTSLQGHTPLYKHARTHTRAHACTSTQHIHFCAYMLLCPYVHVLAHGLANAQICICTHACTHPRARAHAAQHARMHHTWMHACKCAQACMRTNKTGMTRAM